MSLCILETTRRIRKGKQSMVLTKILLAGSLLTSSLSGVVSTDPAAQTTLPKTEVQPRLFGTLNSGWLTATSGRSQIIVNFTHELATNRIVYVNSVVSFNLLIHGNLMYLNTTPTYSVNGNTAVITVQYSLEGTSAQGLQTYTDTYYLTVN